MQQTDDVPEGRENSKTTWGPRLFLAVLVGGLVFFWWLAIYSHGVVPHHG